MGRIAGVTAEETRERLLASAAAVFARRGYEGSSIAEITSEAGLSSGAVYAHYESKADLFVATLRAHTVREVELLLGGSATANVADLITARGAQLDRRDATKGSLLMEAIVAAKRDRAVAGLLASMFAEREALFTELLHRAQRADEMDAAMSPEAVARFTLMVALGSLLVSTMDLPDIDHDEWATLITRLVDTFRTNARAQD